MTETEFKQNNKFVVIACFYGQPYYYRYKNLISALLGYAGKYLKYGGANIALKEIDTVGYFKIERHEVKR